MKTKKGSGWKKHPNFKGIKRGPPDEHNEVGGDLWKGEVMRIAGKQNELMGWRSRWEEKWWWWYYERIRLGLLHQWNKNQGAVSLAPTLSTACCLLTIIKCLVQKQRWEATNYLIWLLQPNLGKTELRLPFNFLFLSPHTQIIQLFLIII